MKKLFTYISAWTCFWLLCAAFFEHWAFDVVLLINFLMLLVCYWGLKRGL